MSRLHLGEMPTKPTTSDLWPSLRCAGGSNHFSEQTLLDRRVEHLAWQNQPARSCSPLLGTPDPAGFAVPPPIREARGLGASHRICMGGNFVA